MAGYNTSAQFYNSYRALSAIPETLKNVISFFAESGSNSGSKRGKGASGVLVIIIVLIAITLGIFTTQWIADMASDRAESRTQTAHYERDHRNSY